MLVVMSPVSCLQLRFAHWQQVSGRLFIEPDTHVSFAVLISFLFVLCLNNGGAAMTTQRPEGVVATPPIQKPE